MDEEESNEAFKAFEGQDRPNSEVPSGQFDYFTWWKPAEGKTSSYEWLVWFCWNYSDQIGFLIADPLAEILFVQKMYPLIRDMQLSDFLSGDEEAMRPWQGKGQARGDCPENYPSAIFQNIATIAKNLSQ